MKAILDYSEFEWWTDTWQASMLPITSVSHLYRQFKATTNCPFCNTYTELVFDAHLPSAMEHSAEERWVKIWACLACGWWHEEFGRQDFHSPGWERIKKVFPKLKEFRSDDKDIPTRTLLLELASRRETLYEINPKKLENLVASVIADFYEAEVSIIGRSGDGGIDLVYIHAERPFAVQVKRREDPKSKEGVSLVREFLGACLLGGYKNAKIVTTAIEFTKGAKTTAKSSLGKGLLDSYELISMDKFLSYFQRRPNFHRYPWTPSVRDWTKNWKNLPEAKIMIAERFVE